MSLRLAVANGVACLQQRRDDGEWAITKVSRAGVLAPGVYALHKAKTATAKGQYDGVTLAVLSDCVYQLLADGTIVRHPSADMATPPAVGAVCVIAYERGRAQLSAERRQRGRPPGKPKVA